MCTKYSSERFKLKWQSHTKFVAVWTTAGTAEKPLSIWAATAVIPKGKLHGRKKGSNAVKERIVLGHYACTFFGAPSTIRMLEVTDERQSGLFSRHKRDPLRRFLDVFFPHPVRFRRVWTFESNKQLYVWEPVPPAPEYAVIGMLVTTSDVEPSLLDVRCVPKPWVERMPVPSVMWSATGASRTPASWWAENQSNALFRVSAGSSSLVAPEMLCMSPTKFYACLPADLCE